MRLKIATGSTRADFEFSISIVSRLNELLDYERTQNINPIHSLRQKNVGCGKILDYWDICC